jgi:hypothetical protein
VHPHRVSRLEARDLAELLALDVLDDRAHGKGAGGRAEW